MKTNKTFLSLTLLIGGLSSLCHAQDWNTMSRRMRENSRAMMRHFDEVQESLFREFDDLFSKSEKRDKDFHASEIDAVALPEIAIEKSKDEKNLSVIIKGIKAKKDDFKGEFDEEQGYSVFTFPYQGSSITVHIYPRGLTISAHKKIVDEKKDESGKVLASSTSFAHNEKSEFFPFKITPDSITSSFKDDSLTLTLTSKQTKRPLAIK